MTDEGPVRRVDLRLRARHPELETVIYRIAENKFLIYIMGTDIDLNVLKKEFNHSIKMITSPVKITDQIPESFIERVPNIADNEIPKNFEGIPFSKVGLLNLLIAKFPSVNFYKITNDKKNVNIHTAEFDEIKGDTTRHHFLSKQDRKDINVFLQNLKTSIEFNIIEEKHETKPEPIWKNVYNPVHFIYATKLRDSPSQFSQRDEAIWFDNIDKIFNGVFKKEDLYFYDSSEYSCYIDYSSFPNIDLRNHLFLFETIYLTPPFEKSIPKWLLESKIEEHEFFELINRGRIKVVLTQPENRYDQGFINSIYSLKPDSLISRRGISCLQQIDIVDIACNYIFNDVKILGELKNLCSIISKSIDIEPTSLYQTLIWPIKAHRESFEILNHAGSFGIPSFGVNKAVEKRASKIFNKDLDFEFTTNASAIHLANSLNAIYFPFKTKDGYSDIFYASVMGDMLNFYKCANSTDLNAFRENKKLIESGILPISPIEVIEINTYIPITELESELSKETIYPQGKMLIKSLSELSIEERIKKIKLYNSEVRKKINKKNKNKNAIDLGTNVLIDTASALSGIGILGSAISLLKMGSNKAKDSIPLVRNTLEKIDKALNNDLDSANIHFLTKINRVAKIKRI